MHPGRALLPVAWALHACTPHAAPSATDASDDSAQRVTGNATAVVVVAKPAPSAATSSAAREPGPAMCMAHRGIEAACRWALAQLGRDSSCGPKDCTSNLLADEKGVSVHLLTIEEFACEGECDERGLLGEPLGISNSTDCYYSYTETIQNQFLLLAYDGRMWPAMHWETSTSNWYERDVSVQGLSMPDTDHVAWTVRDRETNHIEPDAGSGGSITQSLETWYLAQLGPRRPKLRHRLALSDRRDDQTQTTQMEGESDAEYSARKSEEDALRKQFNDEQATQVRQEPPALSDVPQCGPEHDCPPICQVLSE